MLSALFGRFSIAGESEGRSTPDKGDSKVTAQPADAVTSSAANGVEREGYEEGAEVRAVPTLIVRGGKLLILNYILF